MTNHQDTGGEGLEKWRGIDTSLGQAGWCIACEREMGDGPDICIGMIPGVSHACCGHGNVGKAYVVLGGPEGADPDCETYRSLTFYGPDAAAFFALVKRGEIREPAHA